MVILTLRLGCVGTRNKTGSWGSGLVQGKASRKRLALCKDWAGPTTRGLPLPGERTEFVNPPWGSGSPEASV